MADPTERDRDESQEQPTGYSEGNQRHESLDDAGAGSSPKRKRSAGDDLGGNDVSGTGEGKEAGDTSGLGDFGGRGNTNTGGFGVDEQVRPNPELERQ